MIPKQAFFVYGEHHQNPMPQLGASNIEDFKRLNPDLNVNLITIENSNKEHADVFEWNKLIWSQIIRFELIAEHGGLYSDVDICYYGKVPNMEGCELVLAVEKHGGTSDAFFAASPGNKFLTECRDKSVKWAKERMDKGVKEFTTEEMFKGCGVIMFSQLSKKHTGFHFVYEPQIHMTQEDFNGSFQPQDKVGMLPFEALCRHNKKNWVGWHQCWGSWRPRTKDDQANMEMTACIKTNG